MKKYLIALMGLFFFLTAVPYSTASAADKSQFAVVDFTKVITDSEAGKKANTEITELIKAKKAGPEKIAQDYEKVKKELNDPALSAVDQKKKQDDLNRLFQEYQKNVAQSNQEIENRTKELKAKIFTEVSDILKQMAKEKGYVMIQDITTLPYYDPDIEITKEVIDRYNATSAKK